jgi:hypothetical protein
VQCSSLHRAGQVGVAVDGQWPVHLYVLLQCPFQGCVGIKLLEAQLEVLGSPKGDVLHLASLSRQVFDPGAACTARNPTSCMLLVVRSVRGDNDASGSSEEEW